MGSDPRPAVIVTFVGRDSQDEEKKKEKKKQQRDAQIASDLN